MKDKEERRLVVNIPAASTNYQLKGFIRQIETKQHIFTIGSLFFHMISVANLKTIIVIGKREK